MAKTDRCTALTTGTVTAKKSQGVDNPTLITVAYQVNGVQYTVTESIKLKIQVMKLGFLPIGQKKTPAMGNTAIGASVRVCYDPADPSNACLPDNTGHIIN